MNSERSKLARSLALPIVSLATVGMALAWVLTPSYGPWLTNAAAAIPTLIVAFIWGETARNLRVKPRALAWASAVGLALSLASWQLGPPLAHTFPTLGAEIKRLYATLNHPPGPLKALPILLLTTAVEELVWRGELVTWLQKRYGFATTVIVATLAYSLPIAASQSLLLFVMATLLGATFTIERIISGSWVAPLVSHTIWALGVFVVQPIG